MGQLQAEYKNLRANLAAVEKEYKSKCAGQATPECIRLKAEIDKLRREKNIMELQLRGLVDCVPRDPPEVDARPQLPDARDEPTVGVFLPSLNPLYNEMIIRLFL